MYKNQTKTKQLCFRRWLNKKYAAFNSLGRLVKICPLALSYTLVSVSVSAKGEDDSISVDSSYDIEEVQVAGSRSPLLEEELAKIVNIVPAVNLESSPSASINDYLDYLPGVDVRTRGPMGVQSDLSIRGGNFEQTTILLNGVKITDPQTGHNSLNLPIDLNSIKRIELIKGSSSRVFGAGAFSGALNIIVLPDYDNNITAGLEFGENDFYNYTASINKSIKNTRHLLTYNMNGADGYVENTDYTSINLYYHSICDLDLGKLAIQAGYQDKAAGAQNFYTRAFPTQFEQMRTKFASVSFEKGEKLKWNPKAYIRRGHDRFELYREGKEYYNHQGSLWINHVKGDTALSFYRGHNYHMNTVYGIESDLSYVTLLGTTTLGYEYRSENILSNTMGDLVDTIAAPGENEGFLFREKSRFINSLYLEHKVNHGRISLNGGLLIQHSSDFKTYYFPGIDVRYNITDAISLFGNVNMATRLPSFTELYYRTSTHMSDPLLKPENSLSTEYGLIFKSTAVSLYGSIFVMNGGNLIDWVQDPDNLVLNSSGIAMWQSKNITTSTTLGTEMLFDMNMSELWDERFPIKRFSIGYTFLDKDISSGNYLSAYALDYLRHKINMEMNNSFKNVYFNVYTTWFERSGYIDWITRSKVDFDSYLLIDCKLAYRLKKMELYLNANNIFDINYNDYLGLDMPGRWLRLGLKYKLMLRQ